MILFDAIPAIIRIGVIFVGVLVAMRLKVSLGSAMLAGAIGLGLIFRQTPVDIGISIFHTLIHPKTLALIIVVALILILSHSMEKTGQMKRLLDSFQGLMKHGGINLTLFPALIGLLPMPGGAIFSAPMVKDIGERYNIDRARLSYINYWFRHVWEYWWPFYPGVILSISLADLDLLIYTLFLLPLSIVSITVAYLPIRRFIKQNNNANQLKGKPRLKTFMGELIPIVVVVVVGLGSGTLLSAVYQKEQLPIVKEIGLIIGLIISLAIVWTNNRMSISEMGSMVINKHLFNMIFMVMAILIFKGILQDSNAVVLVSEELNRFKIPLMPITIILPFMVGYVTGITIAFAGTTFPIIVSLINAYGQTDLMLPYIMLGLVNGFAGVLFSPLHLCFLLSNEFFKTTIGKVLRTLWLPNISVMFFSWCYFFILRVIL